MFVGDFEILWELKRRTRPSYRWTSGMYVYVYIWALEPSAAGLPNFLEYSSICTDPLIRIYHTRSRGRHELLSRFLYYAFLKQGCGFLRPSKAGHDVLDTPSGRDCDCKGYSLHLGDCWQSDRRPPPCRRQRIRPLHFWRVRPLHRQLDEGATQSRDNHHSMSDTDTPPRPSTVAEPPSEGPFPVSGTSPSIEVP